MRTANGFAGFRVAAFESRMGKEMERLIRRYGGEPLVAPALRELPLEDNTTALAFGHALMAGEIHVLILLTGVGTRALVTLLGTRYQPADVTLAMSRVRLVARGPKPIAALKELALTPDIAVPEPNTWRDLLRAVDGNISLTGLRVAVQEYGVSNPELLDGLRARGATVVPVPIYRWALPEDTAPLQHVLAEVAADQVHIMLITNAAQVDHAMQLATERGLVQPFMKALPNMVVASIGPTASERLRSHGWPVDLEPSHPKMGILVKETSEQAGALLSGKRREPQEG